MSVRRTGCGIADSIIGKDVDGSGEIIGQVGWEVEIEGDV